MIINVLNFNNLKEFKNLETTKEYAERHYW
jgi:hypothetical protein